jgi:two-component system cell cycle sensor histidine kinase/response regulator CckA
MLNDLIAQNIPMGVILTQDGRICFMNPWAKQYMGYDDTESMSSSFLDFIHPDDRDRIIVRYQDIISGRQPPRNERYRIVGKEGQVFWIRFRSTCIEYKGKTALLSFLIDETVSKAYEMSLETSEQRYRNLVNNIAEGIVVVQAGRVCFINKTLEDKLELKVSDIAGKAFLEFIHPEDREMIIDRYQRRLKGENLPESYECRLIKPSGEVLICELRATKIVWESEPATQTAILDITERKQAEEERKKFEQRLVRMEKMEALGILAGGVAHDLNNVLSGIVSYPELLLLDLPEGHRYKKPLELIHDSGLKASAIVNDLLTLARRGVMADETVNLNIFVSEYLDSPEFKKMISYHPGIEIVTCLESQLMNIKGSGIHLRKTIMNLVSNAAEAQPDGGKIKISTLNQYVDTPVEGYSSIRSGEYALMKIEDQGIGIAPEDMDRIFEPFYTKKKMGRSGTGLGMAVVWGTVQDHKGYITVKSRMNEGTCFSLYFPVVRQEPSFAQPSRSAAELLGSNQTILVVDDVKEQRHISAQILKRLNYKPVKVASGEDALIYLKQGPCSLVLLDMVMEPGIDGLETYKRIKQIDPEMKVIITSGFSESNKVKEAQQMGAGRFIKKPYSVTDIGLAIKQAFECKRG